ncbi:two-component sensor histidine kinase [Streptomyces yaizuensis]|uniref:histidine kinase n=1 Tax=Streptomyces yaizuensis TaxID=2989713 RepID=A0ABQ5P004_9ACTN|nr:two-component sensor histidine kinase [Streptomyces sp. YSPA8]
MTQKTHSPEYQLAAGAAKGLPPELFRDAFAPRPLPRMRTDGPLTRRLPAGRRAAAAWAPHAVIAFLTLVTVLISAELTTGYHLAGSTVLVLSLIPVGTVLLAFVRPTAAFWLSLIVSPVVAVGAGSAGFWPWSPASFFTHLIVMVLAARATRPAIAGWMWATTVLYALLSEVFMPGVGSSSAWMLFLSSLAMLTTSLVHVRRQAAQDIAAEQSVTAVERDRRTTLEERTTIARELHDVVAHHMSVVAIQAEAAPYRVENPPPELEQAFATIRENAVAALTELRRILGVVRAEDYEAPDAPQPVLADLDGLLANVREAGLTTEKAVTGAVRTLPQGVELSAYRIVQEALSNALRHAPGSTARVEVGYVLGGLGLRVVNTAPQGLVKPSPGAGHGITGMRERVAMLGGALTHGPTGEGGYEVTAFIPVAPADDETTADTVVLETGGDPA